MPTPPDDVRRNRSASGGVNTFSSALDIKDDQAVDLTNLDTSVPGVRRVRSGTSVIATGVTNGPILAMSEYTPSSFTSELLVVAPGATYPQPGHLKLYKWDGTGSTFTFIGTLSGMTAPTLPVEIIVGTDLAVGSVTNSPAVARITSRQNLDYDYMYGGSALSACTGGNARPSTGMFPMTNILDRGFAAGRAGTNRGKVFYSDVGSFTWTGWGSSQSFTMGGGTRQEIIALKEFRADKMIVFQADRIEFLQINGNPFSTQSGVVATNDAAGWSRGVIDRRIGCGSRRSVQTVGEDLFFVDQYGNVRSLARTITDNDQGTKRLPISANIQSWVDRINMAALDQTQAAAYDNYYLVAYPIDNAVTPSHVFRYNVINDAWDGPWSGTFAGVGCFAVATLNGATASTDRNPTLYIGGASTGPGLVYRSLTGTGDDGGPVVLQETTKRQSFDALETTKSPKRLRIYALPAPGATLMAETRKDGGSFSLTGYADLSGSSPQLPQTLPIDLTGSGIVEKVMTLEGVENVRDLQHRFTVTASVDVQILGYTTQVQPNNIDWTPN